MNRVNWIQVLVVGGVALLIFILGLAFLPVLFGGRGYGWMGSDMMGGWSPWCGTSRYFGGGMMGFGLFFTLLLWLIPLGLLALVLGGGLWLIRNLSRATVPSAPVVRTCADCGQPVQPDWQHCPHCGTAL